MIIQLLAGSGVSISDLKKNPTAVIEAAGGFPVAVLNRNTPAAYLVPAKAWRKWGHARLPYSLFRTNMSADMRPVPLTRPVQRSNNRS